MLCPCSGQVVRSKPPGTACRAPTGRNTLPTTDSLPVVPLGILDRVRVCLGLLSGLRRHDFRAARTWIRMMYAGRHSFPVAIVKFSGWAVRQMLGEIPQAMQHTTWARTVSKTPSWLAQGTLSKIIPGSYVLMPTCPKPWTRLSSGPVLPAGRWPTTGRNERRLSRSWWSLKWTTPPADLPDATKGSW